jgi:hypothetical protein
MKNIFFIFFLTVFVLSACGTPATTMPTPTSTHTAIPPTITVTSTPETVNATGMWVGPVISTGQGDQTVTIIIQQTGVELTGTYSSTLGVTGTVVGTASGNTLTVQIAFTTSGCSGTFDGTSLVDTQPTPWTMSLQYSGTTTCQGAQSGTGILSKQ